MKLTRTLSIALSIMILAGALTRIIPASANTNGNSANEFYISVSGSDENNGTTHNTAVRTVKKAIELINAAGLGENDTATVYVDSTADGKPLLGICLGMQLLFDESHEYGVHKGLGLIKGKIASIDEDLKKAGIAGLKVPHIGWNSLQFEKDEPLFRYNKPGDYVYYVHSFYGTDCEESIIATSEYGVTITGAVRSGKVYGTQFHPEKSGEAGLKMLKAFMEV